MKKALIVGIDTYESAPLHGCVNDASSLASILEKHDDDSPNFDVRLLTNITTKSELKGAITELFEGDNDISLLYFSGHGFLGETGGYIVTPDYKKYDEGVSMNEILTIVNNSKAKNKIVILDCCHSGAFGSPSITNGEISHVGEGVVVLTASRNSETALEINGHGLFSSLLLDALQGGASDLRGHITPGSVYAYIDQALGPWSQRPVFKTNVSSFTSLRTVNPPVPLDTLRKIVEYFPKPQQEFNLDPSYEDTNSITVEHTVIEPYAKSENIAVFKALQKMQSVGLIVPVNSEYMYFAAMESKSCKLTALGHHYWKLVQEKKI